MHLAFYDKDDNHICVIAVCARDEMEACERGHQILLNGTIRGAEDFQIVQRE